MKPLVALFQSTCFLLLSRQIMNAFAFEKLFEVGKVQLYWGVYYLITQRDLQGPLWESCWFWSKSTPWLRTQELSPSTSLASVSTHRGTQPTMCASGRLEETGWGWGSLWGRGRAGSDGRAAGGGGSFTFMSRMTSVQQPGIHRAGCHP